MDKKEIIQKKLNEVETNLKNQDFLSHYILETLNSFGHRYFDDPKVSEQVSTNVLRVLAIESGIKEAIKLKNLELRAGIMELVKRVSKAEGPTILREIRVTVLPKDSTHKGECHVTARISFGHPYHDFKKGTFVEKLSVLVFEDEIQFRNNLAKHLELACEIF